MFLNDYFLKYIENIELSINQYNIPIIIFSIHSAYILNIYVSNTYMIQNLYLNHTFDPLVTFSLTLKSRETIWWNDKSRICASFCDQLKNALKVNANGTVVLGPQNERWSAKTHVHKNESTIRPSPKPQTHNLTPTVQINLTVIHHSKHKFVVAYDR